MYKNVMKKKIGHSRTTFNNGGHPTNGGADGKVVGRDAASSRRKLAGGRVIYESGGMGTGWLAETEITISGAVIRRGGETKM